MNGRLVIAAAAVPFAVAMSAAPATASPPVSPEFDPTLTGLHTHHVHTGNGGCVDIDSVFFLQQTRGLHQGANASGGAELGPFHLTCAAHPS